MRRLINHFTEKFATQNPQKGPFAMALFFVHLGVIAAISWVLTNDSELDDRWGLLFVGLWLMPTAWHELLVKKEKTAGGIKLAAALIFIFLFFANDGSPFAFGNIG